MLQLCSYRMAPAAPQTGSPAWALGEGRAGGREQCSARDGAGGPAQPSFLLRGWAALLPEARPHQGFLLLTTTNSTPAEGWIGAHGVWGQEGRPPSRSPSSRWQDCGLQLRVTRGLLRLKKKNKKKLQPTAACSRSTARLGPAGADSVTSTLKELESFLLKCLSPPLHRELGRGGGVGAGRQGWAWVLWGRWFPTPSSLRVRPKTRWEGISPAE